MKPLIRLLLSVVILLAISTFSIQAQVCVVPDDGTGTASLPPLGCEYYSPDEVFMIIDGLPPGTTIELDGVYSDFICCGASCPNCSLPLAPGECEIPGGSLGGNGHCFNGIMVFQVKGTGDLAGYNRTLYVEIFSEIHTGPRNPGDPVQEFPADYYRFAGQLYGDPDFCTFNIIAGTDYGLPGPGHTTLTQLPGGDFAVDSFFDITYQIQFEGCPGSTLDGYMGTTTATIRIETGGDFTLNDFIDPGPDFWIVPESPASSVHPGGPGGDIDPIPADFFGPGSDPFDGVIALQGESLGSTEFPNPDAIIERTSPANLPEPYPSSDLIPIEIIELSLVSTAPIVVTYNGGLDPELWNVELELSTNPQPAGNMDITKNDANGGVFNYLPLYVYPRLIFTQTSPPYNTMEWDLGGTSLLEYTNSIAYPWEHSPIGNDFNPSGTTPLELISSGGDCELFLLPYLLRQDDFWVELDPGGVFIAGGGSGYNDGAWYYYPNYDWWNIWFYDHPFEYERTKAISVALTIDQLDPSLPSYANIVFNWSTGDWSEQGVPGRPPLPEDVTDPALEDNYIVRSIPVYAGPVTGPISINDYFFEILQYNPEWISIDVEGWNFVIPDGIINHVCSQPESGGNLFEFGDAPEMALAYPSLGITGLFPTCINEPVSGWVQHNDVSAWLGPQADLELEGNAGACPAFNPNQYNLDECFGNGDAGLLIPESFTITGALGSETVVPCTGFIGMPLGYICQTAEWGIDIDIDLHNQIPSGDQAYINLLIDWNQDGQWAGSSDCPGYAVPEHVLVDYTIPNPFDGPLSALMAAASTIPIGPNPGYVWVRFSITDIPVGQDWNGEGVFEYGETEDYLLFVGEQGDLDWGDAPDSPYPTLGVNNGAHHVIVPQIYLGISIDGEPDGQPDIQALGDDNDIFYPPVNDDEDGVIFTSGLISGQNATVDVVASIPGLLNAWIDFDQNGSWAELNEHVFIDIPLVPGINNLVFTVPAGVGNGNTYARFRFSTAPGILFDGPAPDGEVEDYRVYIGGQTGDVPIDTDPTGTLVHNEISMALVPGTQPGIPAVLLAAYNDHPYPGGPGLGVSYSHDGGAIWNPLQLPYPSNPLGIPYMDMFDPTATADAFGDLYVAHISTDYDWTNGPESGLYVHKSTDGGVSWAAPVTVAYDAKPIGSPDPNYRFNDRCQMTCDLNPASPYYNNIYIVEIKDRGWNNPLLESDIYFSSSTDGGFTWAAQVILNENIHNLGNMPVPAVAPDGTIYVCWMDYNVQTGGIGTIYMNISTDGGVTWLSTDILVTTVNLPPLRLNGGTDVLAKGAAVIEVSPFNSQELYIVYAEDPDGAGPDECDIFFIRSLDAGNTWTIPLRVNDDLTTNDQVLPWIDVKPNGTIDIAFYGRYDDGDINWRIVMAMSTDGGNSFTPNIQVNSTSAPSPFTPSGYWMGEYLGLVADNTHAYVGFTSSISDINGDVYFVKTQNPLAEIDFGDAPDPTYPTLLASDGARHNVDGVTFLGALIDAEPDGQPDPNALGDDNNYLADEDGIVFNQIIQGSSAQITVTTSTAGYLQGWLDFNADGDWADPGEQIFADAYIHFGYTVCLNYYVPINAVIGPTHARFRFSTVGGLSYTGSALNGEVEDYEVAINENPDIKWSQEPCTQLPGLHCTDDVEVLADDWECFGGLVTDIHWWGNYESNITGNGINYFHLSIHDNDPTTCLPLDPEIWGVNVALASVNEANTGLTNSMGEFIYEYDYILDIPFEQTEGNFYWLDICAYSIAGDLVWRWQESARSTVPVLCPAAHFVPPWQSIVWNTPSPTRFSDMAFAITSVEPEDMDFGDAKDPTYPTLLASDGARHIIDAVTFMGASIDADADGQPHPNALGDDNDGNDDEDGVTFTSPVYLGQSATVDVIASVDGVLNAWMDFDGNGSWGDPGEQIFTDVPLTVGTNNLTYYVSSIGITGPSYVRFRFSTVSGLSFTGIAPDGEVEDYEVDIEAGLYKWVQHPDPGLPGLHAHNWDSPPYGAVILADDWICEGGWVTDIHWWGNYEMAVGGIEWRGAGIQYFHLSIHAHDLIACLPQDPEIWGIDVPFTALNELFTGIANLEGSPIYLYEYILEEPFQQIQGVQYWLDITAFCIDPLDPAHWRWQESARNQTPVLCGAAEKSLPNPGIWHTISWADGRFSDMAFMITSESVPDLDMGDAADPTYPTLLINNGAAHIIDGVTYLGSLIDAEPDGQPDPNALGDDNNNLDDEDGVSIISPLYSGGTGGLAFEASVDGYLNGWIDYNNDGDWDEADEHAFIDVVLYAGNNSIFFPIPNNANIGTTTARFRFSTSTGLAYTGIASDGEVEDHEVTIEGEVDVNLKVFLEGPYSGTIMTTILNAQGLIPLNQPYNSDPVALWYYTGSESVISIPNTNITDWIVVEFRDASSAALAAKATMVNQQAAFLLNDGSVVTLDGTSPVKVNGIYQDDLFVVIWHRNHLGVLSANPLVLSGLNQYSYDFTTPAGQAYLNGQKSLGGSIYGMYGGDSRPDGSIDNLDKAVWTNSAGTTGYLPADNNMDTQVDNKDKDDIWVPNNGSGTHVPN